MLPQDRGLGGLVGNLTLGAEVTQVENQWGKEYLKNLASDLGKFDSKVCLEEAIFILGA